MAFISPQRPKAGTGLSIPSTNGLRIPAVMDCTCSGPIRKHVHGLTGKPSQKEAMVPCSVSYGQSGNVGAMVISGPPTISRIPKS